MDLDNELKEAQTLLHKKQEEIFALMRSRIAAMDSDYKLKEKEAQTLLHNKQEEIDALKGRLAAMDSDNKLKEKESQKLLQEKEEEISALKGRLDLLERNGTGANEGPERKRFDISITKSAIENGLASVPKDFVDKNDMMTQYKTVELRNGAGDSWRTELHVMNASVVNARDEAKPRKRVRFTGLQEFVRENKLEVGDICTFELADQASSSSEDVHVVMDVAFKRRQQG